MTAINPIRHMDVFNPATFGNKRIDVIGAGATGSRVILEIAKLGVSNLHAWDFDIVEAHNIANQAFWLSHIGKPKVDAIKEVVKASSGLDLSIHPEKVDGATKDLGQIVFLMVDSMKARREIFDGAIENNFATELLIETRMGADEGRVYAFNPQKPEEVRRWKSFLYDDPTPQEQARLALNGCGGSTTVGSTAAVIAGLAVWQLIQWNAIQNGTETELVNELVISLRTGEVLKGLWNKHTFTKGDKG